jgi:hypothetical protein
MVPKNYSVSALSSFRFKVLFYIENNFVAKSIFRLIRFPVYRGSGLGRFYCIICAIGKLVSYEKVV